MTKRFTDNETNCLIDSSFTDNLTKKIYVIDEWERIIGLCNNLWNQTQRFEKHNQELVEENEQLKQREKTLEGMIRTFDEGCKEIYDDKCRLKEENEQLKQENKKLKEDLEHCANQFTNDGKNVLLSLR